MHGQLVIRHWSRLWHERQNLAFESLSKSDVIAMYFHSTVQYC